ncbi:MAG TPA: hypothetical protein PK812_06850 [Beijerinckiaceae bacterium]|nr:hypothetical protein [Beijerinckiaceae bacterium]
MNHTEDERAAIMQKDGLLIGIAGLSLVSGMHFSPYFDPAFVLVSVLLAPGFFITSKLLLFYFTSLLVALAALAIAGVPAAIFERVTGRKESDFKSMSIWLAGCFVIALPALIP